MTALKDLVPSRFAFIQRWTRVQRGLAFIALPIIAIAVSFGALSQSSPPAFAPVALASDPLYASTSGDKPTMALALSVEYPTVGAQYTPGSDTDTTYSNNNEYIGYYDAESCYAYNDAPTETPGAGQTIGDLKRFYRTGPAASRMCSDAFSGNFLNWASNSAIDMLRLALSGGDRYIDTPSLTVLQRAVIPNGDPICMWNTTNFPAKRLYQSGGASGRNYFGAVPSAMVTAAGGSDIWVGNTLNRIYFGNARGGSCGDPSSYKLGAPTATATIGPVTARTGPLPNDFTSCASENAYCSVSGTHELWYGANNSWRRAIVVSGADCKNSVFGDPIPNVVKKCYTRPTTETLPGTGTRLNSEGYFYARVQVCEKDGAGVLTDNRDYGLCTKYPNGNFKPTGVVQKYSDQLRLSAFGYLLDQTNSVDGGRYGGVLRAPMKYVGQKTFDVYGQENTPSGGNTKAEWSASTGVFATNPDGDAMGISGVLNYLNKFGRTGPTAGKYKIYDPVSELYYETLRYMQGLQPSALAVSNVTADMQDGFPYFADWSALDPFAGRVRTGNYACLKNNIVVIGDVNTHDGNRFPTVNLANNIPDRNYWTTVVRDFEQGTVRNYTDGQGVSRATANPNTRNGGPRSDGIVGYSYWAHTQDIRGTAWTGNVDKQRPGLRIKTFIFDVNEYGAQNDANTRRYNNQFFTAAKYGGFESDPANTGNKPFNTYGNPFKRQDGTNDNNVWQKPSDPGEASAYYLQSSARGVLRAFDDIFGRAVTTARSIAGSAAAAQKLSTGTAIYQGSFDTSNWSGDLQSFALAVDANQNVTIASSPTWSAAEKLAERSTPATSRNIVIGNAGATAVSAASNFDWGDMSAALKVMLNKPSPEAAEDGLGEDRVAFLRGSTAREGNPFRNRGNKLLGDIINSGVFYSGAPPDTISSSTYAEFRADHITRAPALFVGANDGMLHAFDAATGSEIFGYIPSWLAPKLPALTGSTYAANHQSYVDASPVVAEAEVGSAGTKADWKTVLVSGTGAGGKGVFALDVSDPGTFSASNVMWEFTNADDADLGFVVGKPQILKMRTSAAGATPAYKWFAVVASGVDNYVSDSAGRFSTTGQPAIFLLDLAKPASTAWALNSNYYKISLPVNATLAATVAPGVINFEAVAGVQREVTQIYAGDLHGNMWKLDFRQWGTAGWNMNNLSAFSKGSGGSATPYPLFIAKDSTGKVQPISMSPALVAGQRSSSTYVAFGTGKYLEVADRSSTTQDSFYVVHDNGTNIADSTPAGASVISGRARLQLGTLSNGNVSVGTFVWGRATSDNDNTQRSGWYIDYGAGERQVSNTLLDGSKLIFGSLIPGTSGGANSCGVSGGSGNEYRLNVDTGEGQYRVSTVGVMGQPVIMEMADSESTTSNSTGRRTRTISSQVIRQGSTGIDPSAEKSTRTIIAGRLSWRQINNYQDLKSATP